MNRVPLFKTKEYGAQIEKYSLEANAMKRK